MVPASKKMSIERSSECRAELLTEVDGRLRIDVSEEAQDDSDN